MIEDTSPENLRKFLESDDPAMVQMGLMAEGIDFTEEFLPTILRRYMWGDDKTVLFMEKAPDDAKQIVKENWKASYERLVQSS